MHTECCPAYVFFPLSILQFQIFVNRNRNRSDSGRLELNMIYHWCTKWWRPRIRFSVYSCVPPRAPQSLLTDQKFQPVTFEIFLVLRHCSLTYDKMSYKTNVLNKFRKLMKKFCCTYVFSCFDAHFDLWIIAVSYVLFYFMIEMFNLFVFFLITSFNYELFSYLCLVNIRWEFFLSAITPHNQLEAL